MNSVDHAPRKKLVAAVHFMQLLHKQYPIVRQKYVNIKILLLCKPVMFACSVDSFPKHVKMIFKIKKKAQNMLSTMQVFNIPNIAHTNCCKPWVTQASA